MSTAKITRSRAGRPVRPSIGIVGCGTLGRAILEAVDSGRLAVPIVGVTDLDEAKARAYLSGLRQAPPYLDLGSLIASADLVVETAGADVVPELARRVFGAGKDLLVISVGALLDHPELFDEARSRNCRLFLPSGAIAGVDGVKSACVGHVDRVTLTTRKPPAALEGAPYLRERGITLHGLTEEREIFCGSVREACRGFPASVNVSATVSLAGVGPERTTIRIVAVPGLERNTHVIEAEGDFGSLRIEVSNRPTENPRTGRLTALSIIRTLGELGDVVRIGT
ncbi:MAG: aspartate dehydrogenase [Gemmatimonadetes bacterium]|nr:aspartate dehydrogenase [Gemmatimonadota bacterium]